MRWSWVGLRLFGVWVFFSSCCQGLGWSFSWCDGASPEHHATPASRVTHLFSFVFIMLRYDANESFDVAPLFPDYPALCLCFLVCLRHSNDPLTRPNSHRPRHLHQHPPHQSQSNHNLTSQNTGQPKHQSAKTPVSQNTSQPNNQPSLFLPSLPLPPRQ
jgi:hypothetical protein